MTILHLEAPVAITLALSVLMAFAWVVQRRTGNSGWVDTIWTSAVGLVGAGSAQWPVGGRRPTRGNGWSRHPNYFFEWFCWLAYPVIGLSLSYPWGLATLLAPVFMYWILVYVTGVPPPEEQMLRSRGERYRAYQLRTSKFLPAAAVCVTPKMESSRQKEFVRN